MSSPQIREQPEGEHADGGNEARRRSASAAFHPLVPSAAAASSSSSSSNQWMRDATVVLSPDAFTGASTDATRTPAGSRGMNACQASGRSLAEAGIPDQRMMRRDREGEKAKDSSSEEGSVNEVRNHRPVGNLVAGDNDALPQSCGSREEGEEDGEGTSVAACHSKAVIAAAALNAKGIIMRRGGKDGRMTGAAAASSFPSIQKGTSGMHYPAERCDALLVAADASCKVNHASKYTPYTQKIRGSGIPRIEMTIMRTGNNTAAATAIPPTLTSMRKDNGSISGSRSRLYSQSDHGTIRKSSSSSSLSSGSRAGGSRGTTATTHIQTWGASAATAYSGSKKKHVAPFSRSTSERQETTDTATAQAQANR